VSRVGARDFAAAVGHLLPQTVSLAEEVRSVDETVVVVILQLVALHAQSAQHRVRLDGSRVRLLPIADELVHQPFEVHAADPNMSATAHVRAPVRQAVLHDAAVHEVVAAAAVDKARQRGVRPALAQSSRVSPRVGQDDADLLPVSQSRRDCCRVVIL
jgi:hypothetical protein